MVLDAEGMLEDVTVLHTHEEATSTLKSGGVDILQVDAAVPGVSEQTIALMQTSDTDPTLGFELDEPRLKRAGLDYREFASVKTHASLDATLDTLAAQERSQRQEAQIDLRVPEHVPEYGDRPAQVPKDHGRRSTARQ